MRERKLLGGILILISLFIVYQAYKIFTGWQYRNKVVLGIRDITPFIEIAIAIIIAVIGIALLVKNRSNE
jgi:hypothetical protein